MEKIGIRSKKKIEKVYNIIGDLHGYYNTFLALIEKMPKGKIICSGDLVDRGPKSNQVIQWFIDNSDKGISVMGNHDHMMAHACLTNDYYYEPGIWEQNGGYTTMESYGLVEDFGTHKKYNRVGIPKDHLNFLSDLDLCYETDDLIITHAPLYGNRTLDECCDLGKGFFLFHDYANSDKSVIWNRKDPWKGREKFQIFGHMGKRKPVWYKKTGGIDYALCIDTWKGGFLTGIHWPSRELFYQEIID